MNYKPGDLVDVIEGEFAGKTLEVTRCFPGGVMACFIGRPDRPFMFAFKSVKPSENHDLIEESPVD